MAFPNGNEGAIDRHALLGLLREPAQVLMHISKVLAALTNGFFRGPNLLLKRICHLTQNFHFISVFVVGLTHCPGFGGLAGSEAIIAISRSFSRLSGLAKK